MQRSIVCQIGRILNLSVRTQGTLQRRFMHAGQVEGPTAADIKKNVPELWVRKMKTFFAFYDQNCDGVINGEDHRIFKEVCVKHAMSQNVSKEQIERFETVISELWTDKITEGDENFEWTENKYLERMFAVVSQPGAEEFFRNAGRELFNLFDLNGDGFISKEEDKVMRGGYQWSIVGFSAIDTNRNGEISRDEYLQAYVDFWFNFADETNPSKHLMGPLVKM